MLSRTALILIALLSTPAAMAQDVPAAEEQAEPESADESADESDESAKKGKYLVLPVIITEPAIGEGLALAVVYFHGDKAGDKPRLMNQTTAAGTARRSDPPPTATGVAGFHTSNGTKGAGVGHTRSLKNDKYRLVGVIADLTVKSEIYLLDRPFDFEVAGYVAYASAKRRAGDSNFFFGLSLMALDGDVQFTLNPSDMPPVPLTEFSLTNVGIAGSVTFDRRDNSTMPERGQLVDLSMWRYDEAIGSDFEYTTTRLKALSFHTLHEKFTLGLRLDVSTVTGEPPFFAVPYVSLRGIPALRFQAKTAGAVEIEGRYKFVDRWAGVVFGGTGFTDNQKPELETPESMNAYGAGVRFKAIETKNVWVGLDIAQGPEEIAWYVQVGQGW